MRKKMDAELKLEVQELIDERIRKIEVQRSDFIELAALVRQLAEAQVRTEQRLDALAEAQTRTEQRLDALAEAQMRTEQRLDALAQAQTRTEQRLDALAQAQTRTEQRLDALAQAQARTESAVQELARQVGYLAQQVGRLSDHIGFGLEDIAHVVVPGYLLRHHGIRMGEFERKFFTLDGKQVEVDLYAEGEKDAEQIVIIGEVKSRIFEREVSQFAHTLSELQPVLPKTAFPLMFAYWVHPSAGVEAQKHGIELIASYQR